MIEIGGLKVEESYSEYAVAIAWPSDGCPVLVECDDLSEAETIARNFGAKVLERRCYLTEYVEQ